MTPKQQDIDTFLREARKTFNSYWWHEVEGVEEPDKHNRDNFWKSTETLIRNAWEEGRIRGIEQVDEDWAKNGK